MWPSGYTAAEYHTFHQTLSNTNGNIAREDEKRGKVCFNWAGWSKCFFDLAVVNVAHWHKALTGSPAGPRGPSFPVFPGGPRGPGGPGGPGGPAGPAWPWSPCLKQRGQREKGKNRRGKKNKNSNHRKQLTKPRSY